MVDFVYGVVLREMSPVFGFRMQNIKSSGSVW